MNENYQKITDLVIEKLSQGKIPWKKPYADYSDFRPRNIITKKVYQGVNFFLLLFMTNEPTPWWMTFKQAKKLGGSVRKGVHGQRVIWWKIKTKIERDDQGKDKKTSYPILQTYTVFNLSQCEIPIDKIPPIDLSECIEQDPNERAEAIIANMPNAPKIIKSRIPQPCYAPGEDAVYIPEDDMWKISKYPSIFHELAHASGHESRLDRKGFSTFETDEYGKEELIAEMTAAFLCAECGLDNDEMIKNQAAYCQGFIHRFQDDPKMIICAASKAQEAADYILGRLTNDPEAEAEDSETEAETE